MRRWRQKLKFLIRAVCVILKYMENEKPPKPEPTGKFAEVHKKSREVREKKNQARREEFAGRRVATPLCGGNLTQEQVHRWLKA